MKRLLRTLLTLVLLCSLYGVYASVMRPLVQVEVAVQQRQAPVDTTHEASRTEQIRVSQTWLSEQTWAQEARYRLWSGDTFVFTNAWEPQGEQGFIRFRPFAMVSLRKDRQGVEQAISVVSESALIKFAGRFDTSHPNPGRVVLAALEGEVQVKGPQGLHVAARNLFFDEAARRAWSAHPVEFAFGENRGRGRRLELELIPATGPPRDDRPHVAGIRSIRLIRDVMMDVVLKQKGEPVPIRVSCNGAFEYLVEEGLAVYEDDVRAFRQTSPGQFDGMECDRLTLLLEPKEPPATALASQAATSTPPKPDADKDDASWQRIETDLKFAGLIAEGEVVKLRSDAQHVRGELKRLTYDANQRRVLLAGADGQQLKIRQQDSEIHCPEIEIQLDPAGGLQGLVCSGPGSFTAADPQSGDIAFAADWGRQLRKSSIPGAGLDLLELLGDASFRQGGAAGLTAQHISVWVTPLALSLSSSQQSSAKPALDASARTRPTEGSSTTGGPFGDLASVQPRRITAETDVALVMPKLVAEVDHLDVVFLDEAAFPGHAATIQQTSATAGASDGGLFGALHATGAEAGPDADAADQHPVNVRAKSVRVSLLPMEGQDPQVHELWTEGNVTVQQSSPGKDELKIVGEQIHLQQPSLGAEVVTISGAPAHVHRGLVHLEGGMIVLDRAKNFGKVEGPGLLQLPAPQGFDGRQLDEPALLDIWWQDGMTFSGAQAVFAGNVKATLADSRMLCRLMEVTLTQSIDFSQLQQGPVATRTGGDEASATDEPQIEKIVCREGVEFENHRRTGSRLDQVQRAKVYEFTLHQATGRTTAQGPGWMQSWWRGDGNRRGLAPETSSQANRPAQVDLVDWNYLRVDFAGRMEGNLHQRTMSFRDRVKIVHGPVARPTDTITQDDLPQDGGWMTCNELQATQVRSETNGRDFIQLVGVGDADLEGQGFNARADQISFDESKGLFVLRSFGKRRAEIWYQAKHKQERSHADGQRMRFIPSLNQLFIDQSFGGEGS